MNVSKVAHLTVVLYAVFSILDMNNWEGNMVLC